MNVEEIKARLAQLDTEAIELDDKRQRVCIEQRSLKSELEKLNPPPGVLRRLQMHILTMPPHQKERESGLLLIKAEKEIRRMVCDRTPVVRS